MRKVICLLAVLALLAGTAHAAALNDGLTRDVWARNQGRTVATDRSVVIKLWSDAGVLSNPGVGVSSSTVTPNQLKVYTNYVTGTGITINPMTDTLDTVGEVVDYINTNFASDTSIRIRAEVGRDGRRSMSTDELDAVDVVALGSTDINTLGYVYRQTSSHISVGAEGEPNKINRLKSFNCRLPAPGTTTYTVYDGDTAIWSTALTQTANADPNNPSASCNSVTFPDAKGISSKPGNSIMVDAVNTTDTQNASTAEVDTVGISIVYDQF